MRRGFVLFCLFWLIWPQVGHAQPGPDLTGTLYQTVNIRRGPGARYPIVAQLSDGDTVTVTGRAAVDPTWLRVVLPDGEIGWLPDFMLRPDADLADIPLIIATDATADVTLYTYAPVNVRRGPGMRYALVGELSAGATYRATVRSNPDSDWLYVETADGLAGWVASFTVLVRGNPDQLPVRLVNAAGEPVMPPDAPVLTRAPVNLHRAAAVDSPLIGFIPHQQNVTPLARTADNLWVRLRFGDLTGWTATDLLAIDAGYLARLPVEDAG